MEELSNLPPVLLFAVAVGAVCIHLPLIFSGRLNVPLFYAGLFFLISPFTFVSELGLTLPLKVARYYVVVLMFLSCIARYGIPRFGATAWAFATMSIYYILAAVWSDEPLVGLILKTSGYGVSFFAALLLGSSLRDFDGLRAVNQYILASACLLTLIFTPEVLEQFGNFGRIRPYGLNANMAGLVGASNTVFAFAFLMTCKGKVWKVLALGVMAIGLLMVIMSGSRSALGVSLIPCLMALVPTMRARLIPLLLVVVLPVCGLVYFAISSDLVATETFERSELISGRGELWEKALDLFWEAPVFGQGWTYVVFPSGARGMNNLHNAYLQYLAETGLVGTAIFLVALAILAWQSWRSIRMSRKMSNHGNKILVWFWIGVLLAALAVGIGEASLISGTTILTILFGIGVGIVDRLPRMIRAEAFAAKRKSGPATLSAYPAPLAVYQIPRTT